MSVLIEFYLALPWVNIFWAYVLFNLWNREYKHTFPSFVYGLGFVLNAVCVLWMTVILMGGLSWVAP